MGEKDEERDLGRIRVVGSEEEQRQPGKTGTVVRTVCFQSQTFRRV